MIEIHLFAQLVAFASCGTLSAAAEQLHISQPALSRSMQRLEDELGVKLFDRQKSRLTLNENGALTVQYARSLLMQEESMIEQIREYDRKKRTISVGSCTPVLIPDFVSGECPPPPIEQVSFRSRSTMRPQIGGRRLDVQPNYEMQKLRDTLVSDSTAMSRRLRQIGQD